MEAHGSANATLAEQHSLRLYAALNASDWAVVLPIPPWVLAVLVSIGASAFTVMGFVLQKKALQDKSSRARCKVGDVVLSPGWFAGFLLTAILPVLGDLAAYSLAPLSLTTPLSGVSVVLNMVIAPWALSEQLQRCPDLPATILILVGCCVTTAFGDHEHSGPYTASDLLRLGLRPTFLASVALGAACAVLVVREMCARRAEIERRAAEQQHNPHLPHVILPALAAALCGAVANIGLKGVGELVKGRSSPAHVVTCALVVMPAALIQINFINRGLFLYPQSVFMSVYSAVLVLANTVYGAFFFEEYHVLLSSTPRFAFFSQGCLMIMAGIWLFKLRRPQGAAGTVEEEKGLMEFDGVSELDDVAGGWGCGKAEYEPDMKAASGRRAAGRSRSAARVDDL